MPRLLTGQQWTFVSSSTSLPKRWAKVHVEVAAGAKRLINFRDPVGSELCNPRGIVHRLVNDLARCAVALEFNEHQRPIWGMASRSMRPPTPVISWRPISI